MKNIKKVLLGFIALFSIACSNDNSKTEDKMESKTEDNDKIVFRDDLPSMSVGIDKNRGEVDFLVFGNNEIWADFNGNGKKDKDESSNGGILYKKNPSITTIHIYGEVSQFHCQEELINFLEVSKNPYLEVLDCHHNRIETLDVSKNLKLKVLFCHTNKMSKLDISKNANLQNLNIKENPFTKQEIEKIFTDLPSVKGKDRAFVNIALTKGDHTADISIAQKKNWEVITTRPIN